MTTETHAEDQEQFPKLQGHTVGFVDSNEACDRMTAALNDAGFAPEQILTFREPAAENEWRTMLDGSLWGESAENLLDEGLTELKLGHVIVVVEARNEADAAKVQAISARHGGHGLHHFGLLVDTRLSK